jgi:hypothetical protein
VGHPVPRAGTWADVSARYEPFTAERPAVSAGDAVDIRDAGGEWHTGWVAGTGPRYDVGRAFGQGSGRRVWLTVPVASLADWRLRGDGAAFLNWPAEHVRPGGQVPDSPTTKETT